MVFGFRKHHTNKNMKIERTKNATRNIMFGGILKIYQIILPFIMRTVMIYLMGMEYLGLSSLFTSILQMLNLVELGVGSAMVYSMYRPIAEDDEETICALMKLYRSYYRIIGLIVAILGVILLPLLPKLIKIDTVPEGISIYILYLLHLGATVLSYWLFAYKNSLLNAYQRTDISSKITLITNSLQYLLQIGVLVLFHNYYYYVIVLLFTQIVNNIMTAVIVTKKYPQFYPHGKLEQQKVKEINTRVRDLFTAKLGMVIVNSADTIVISAFLGLNILAIYQNYFYLITALAGIFGVIFNSCTAGIGNSIIIESKDKNFRDLKKFTLLVSWLGGWCTCCLLCLFQPFMEIWVGKENMLGLNAVICFCIYFFIYEINQLLNLYKDAGGIWHSDRFRPLATAMTNLVMNLVMVQFWGIYGVILSTVLSTLIIGMPWLIHNLFTTLFDRKNIKEYLFKLLKYIFSTLLVCMITYTICRVYSGDAAITFIVRFILCCIIPNCIFFVLYRKEDEFWEMIELIDKITKRKMKLTKLKK